MFNSNALIEKPGHTLFKDRFRTVELSIVFRRIHCFKCELTAIYRYRVQELRRSTELLTEENESSESRNTPCEEDLKRWNDIPRFAEIPETIKCKRRSEILGVYTECVF